MLGEATQWRWRELENVFGGPVLVRPIGMNQVRHFVFLTAMSLMLVLSGGPAHGAARCEVLFRSASNLDIRARSDLRVTTMKPSLVKPRVFGSVERFVESLKSIGSAIREINAPSSMTETVLYPMAGFDLTTPLRLFPDATTYVLVDNHTLMRADAVEAFSRRILETEYRDRNGAWIRYDQTGSDIFSKLMTALFATLPKAKIDSIEFITDSQGFVSTKVVVSVGQTGQTKTIYFLAGEIGNVNSQAKTAAHRDEPYSETEPFSRSGNWWDNLVAELAPQTILLKGSMSALRQTAYDEQLLGRERILRPVFSQGGLVVEGASTMSAIHDADWAQRLEPERDRWELSDGDPRLQKPNRERVLRGVEFSYSNNVRIALYDPQRPQKPRRGP